MGWQLIESDAMLQQVLARFADCSVVMVDTEFMRRNTFFPQVALVQLCFVDGGAGEQTAWLIDPLVLDDPTPLADLLVNPAVTKVLHSASEDLEVFQNWLGVLPQPLFDTQRAAALLDRGFGLGYRALVLDICEVDLPKGETRSDWLQRPLTTSQCEYAGLDVTWLLPVWRALSDACEREGKLDWLLSDGENATGALATASAETHKRIKTAWKLPPRKLGALVALCRWREETARERDKPRGWIIDDKACLDLAQHDPQDMEALSLDTELPAPVLRRYGQALLDLLAEQRAQPEESLPVAMPGPLEGAQRDTLKKLKSRSREIAAQLAVAPEVLLPSKDYELLLREAAGAAVVVPAHWGGWRNAVVIAPLRAYLAGGDG